MHTASHSGVELPSIARPRPAVTLLELLVVLSILAVLMAIVLPALGGARSKSMVAECLGNLRQIGACTSLYTYDHGGNHLFPWYQFPAHGGTLQSPGGTYGITLWTPFVFGGFKAPIGMPYDGATADYEVYPAEIRPLNKYVDPAAVGDSIIDLYKCPADRTHTVSIIGEGADPVEDETISSWQANGTSYSFNVRWAQGYSLPSGNYSLEDFNPGDFSGRIAKHVATADAARLIMWVELGFYSATYRAGPTIEGIGGGAMPQRMGWHREFSAWSMAFADGHADYGYFDTRQIYGLGGTIWQPNFQQGP
ncbi:MAG: prepilin-type N-terminal cleavage/methylation domain-containing protein [Phycisphaerae bacterium]|nr:prepilin-type N-terminal cleavage/methylation domain-containing protein [Phycisphaerae bacterium]